MSKVKIYTTTACPYCHMLKSYLKEKNVAFEEVVVDKQPDQVQQVIDNCGSMGVPCTHIEKDDGTQENILGFDKGKINQVLGIS